jgi:uncharacterized protein
MSQKVIQIKHIMEGGEVFVDMTDDEANPCKHCGACCTHYRVSFYQGELQSNGGVVPSEMVTPINSFMVAMKGSEQGGKCSALKGTVGVDSTCSIYHNRPSVCRTFYVWDDEGVPNPRCQELRAKIKLPPLKHLV